MHVLTIKIGRQGESSNRVNMFVNIAIPAAPAIGITAVILVIIRSPFQLSLVDDPRVLQIGVLSERSEHHYVVCHEKQSRLSLFVMEMIVVVRIVV